MKSKIIIALVLTATMFGCSSSSDKEVIEAKENLTEAKAEVQDAKANENEAKANENQALKEKEIAQWTSFRNESDTTIAHMENELKDIQAKIQKSNKRDQEKLNANYTKLNTDIEAMKAKLQQRNAEFENDINSFNSSVSEKNESFKREFKHDADGLLNSLKDVFSNNVK